MRITIVAGTSLGDVQPYIALGLGLQEAGHSVQLAVIAHHADFVRQFGLVCLPMHLEAGQEPVNESNWLLRQLQPDPFFMTRLIANQLKPIEASYLCELQRICQDTDTLILSVYALLGYSVAEALNLPCYAACLPPLNPTIAFPHPCAPSQFQLGARYNRLTYSIFDHLLWRSVRQPINQWRQHELGLPPLPAGLTPMQHLHQQHVPFLYGYSPSLLPKPDDWADWLHVTGYWFLEPPSHWQPPEDLIHFLNAGSPPVYVTFASLNSWNCAVTFELVCAALAKTGQRAIFQIGNSSEEDEWINFPPEVFPLTQWVSYDWLLPQVCAIVHHAGCGTTAYAARTGIPSVPLPAGDDQFFWAKCITASGIGTSAILPNQVSTDRLAAAIQTATSDRQMQFRANALSKYIQAEHGVKQAIAEFHTHLNKQIGKQSFHAANTSVV
jgi:sterol 3beta-glucosyltransferase